MKIDVEKRFPAFDARAFPTYGLCGLTIAAGSALVIMRGYSLNPASFVAFAPAIVLFFIAAICARRIGFVFVGGWLESTALTALFGIASVLLFSPILGMSRPFADATLAWADENILRFYWPDATRWVSDRPSLTLFQAHVYRSLMWQPAGVLALLFLTKKQDRGWQLVNAGMIATLICAVFLFFMPAAGPVVHYGVTPTGLFTHSQWQAGAAIIKIKEGSRIIGDSVGGGLVSVPSFHAAAALILIWATWPTWFRWPFALLNSVLIVSTVVIGAHYLIDVLAGIALGYAAILLAKALHNSRGG